MAIRFPLASHCGNVATFRSYPRHGAIIWLDRHAGLDSIEFDRSDSLRSAVARHRNEGVRPTYPVEMNMALIWVWSRQMVLRVLADSPDIRRSNAAGMPAWRRRTPSYRDSSSTSNARPLWSAHGAVDGGHYLPAEVTLKVANFDQTQL